MQVSCIKAGTLLARLGRPEVRNCINGLEQYSYSYEEAGDQAVEMKKAYSQAQDAGPQLKHMAQFISGITPDTTMAVDEQDLKPDSSASTVSISSEFKHMFSQNAVLRESSFIVPFIITRGAAVLLSPQDCCLFLNGHDQLYLLRSRSTSLDILSTASL